MLLRNNEIVFRNNDNLFRYMYLEMLIRYNEPYFQFIEIKIRYFDKTKLKIERFFSS